jgi:hypothetical protein
MAQKGWWGDKMIVSLSGKDQRRQKQWCEYYRKTDKFCVERVCKCTGSSHCEFYKKKPGVGPIDFVSIPRDVTIVNIETQEPTKPESHIDSFTYIPGPNPSFGEKLLGQIILMKNNFGQITVGEVVSENHDYIVAEKDDGSIVKYNRRTAISMKTFWVLDDK